VKEIAAVGTGLGQMLQSFPTREVRTHLTIVGEILGKNVGSDLVG
jgi:hypothetical protein